MIPTLLKPLINSLHTRGKGEQPAPRKRSERYRDIADMHESARLGLAARHASERSLRRQEQLRAQIRNKEKAVRYWLDLAAQAEAEGN